MTLQFRLPLNTIHRNQFPHEICEILTFAACIKVKRTLIYLRYFVVETVSLIIPFR
jgi:hypothetical protein